MSYNIQSYLISTENTKFSTLMSEQGTTTLVNIDQNMYGPITLHKVNRRLFITSLLLHNMQLIKVSSKNYRHKVSF